MSETYAALVQAKKQKYCSNDFNNFLRKLENPPVDADEGTQNVIPDTFEEYCFFIRNYFQTLSRIYATTPNTLEELSPEELNALEYTLYEERSSLEQAMEDVFGKAREDAKNVFADLTSSLEASPEVMFFSAELREEMAQHSKEFYGETGRNPNDVSKRAEYLQSAYNYIGNILASKYVRGASSVKDLNSEMKTKIANMVASFCASSEIYDSFDKEYPQLNQLVILTDNHLKADQDTPTL